MSRVLPKYDEFIDAFPTVEALAAASPGDVLRAWAPLGYNMRALRLHRAARRIVASRRLSALRRRPRTHRWHRAVHGGDRRVVCVRRAGRRSRYERPAHRRARDRTLERRDAGRRIRAAVPTSARPLEPGDDGPGCARLHGASPKCAQCPIAPWCRSEGTFDHGLVRVAEPRPTYRAEPPFKRSTRFYRGRIVDALRTLPPGRSTSVNALFARIREQGAIERGVIDELVRALERDGLVCITRGGYVRLP